MENSKPTSKDMEAYQKVNTHLDKKNGKVDDYRIFPKPTWFWIGILTIVSVVFYYGLTTLIFGDEFWIRSMVGKHH